MEDSAEGVLIGAAILIAIAALVVKLLREEKPLTIKERIRESEGLIQWAIHFVDELEIPANDRARIAATCLILVQQHHRAIVLTTGASYLASAFALARIEFEAYIRGEWLFRCASDKDIEKFKRTDWLKKVDALKADLETREEFNVDVLSDIMRRNWKAMNSFTHTGIQQIVRGSTETHIEPNFSDEEIVGLLNMADSTALLAMMGIVNMSLGKPADREALAHCLLDRMREFAGHGAESS